MQALVVSNYEPTGILVQKHLLLRGLECSAAHVVPAQRAAACLAGFKPDLIVVVLSPYPEQVLTTIPDLRALTKAPLLVVGPMADSKLVLRTLRSGANEYLDENELEGELEAALARLAAGGVALGAKGRLVGVLGAAGGSGASTIAVNLAVALAQKHQRALLIDLRLETGDLAALLDLRPSHTLADLCDNLSQLDRVVFERSLAQHESGVQLLASPRRLASMFDRPAAAFGAPKTGQVSAEGIRQILTLGRALFPWLVLDLNPTFREEQTQALRMADVLLLVLRLDFTSLRNAQRTLEHLDLTGLDRSLVRLIVNRNGQSKEVPPEKAEEALGLKIAQAIPDDSPTINRANNFGVPAVLDHPGAKVAKSLIQLATVVES